MDSPKIIHSSKSKKHFEKWEIVIHGLEWTASGLFILFTILFGINCFAGLCNKGESVHSLLGTYGDFIGGVLGTFIVYISVRLLVSALKKQMIV